MASTDIGQVVKNIDRRLTNVEQILPTLATKADLDAAIASAVAPLATKAEMRAEIREEGERTRRHFDVVAEGLKDSIKTIAEGHGALSEQIVALKTELKGDIARLDVRVTRLEAGR